MLFYLVAVMRYLGVLGLIVDFFEWFMADKKQRAFMTLPWNCRCCELLGVCRDKDNKWKCRNGCIIINQRKNT